MRRLTAGRRRSYRAGRYRSNGHATRVSGRYCRRASNRHYSNDSRPATSGTRRAHGTRCHQVASPNAINGQYARNCRGNSMDNKGKGFRKDSRNSRRADRCRVSKNTGRIGDNTINCSNFVLLRTYIRPPLTTFKRHFKCSIDRDRTRTCRHANCQNASRILFAIVLTNGIRKDLSGIINFLKYTRYVGRGNTYASGRVPQNFNYARR